VCRSVEIAEELSFNLGMVVTMLWGEPNKEDLETALWYLKREEERAEQLMSDVDGSNAFSRGEEVKLGLPIGVPMIAKKLARVVAQHSQTPLLLAHVLTSLCDDDRPFSEAIELVEAARAEGASAAPSDT